MSLPYNPPHSLAHLILLLSRLRHTPRTTLRTPLHPFPPTLRSQRTARRNTSVRLANAPSLPVATSLAMHGSTLANATTNARSLAARLAVLVRTTCSNSESLINFSFVPTSCSSPSMSLLARHTTRRRHVFKRPCNHSLFFFFPALDSPSLYVRWCLWTLYVECTYTSSYYSTLLSPCIRRSFVSGIWRYPDTARRIISIHVPRFTSFSVFLTLAVCASCGDPYQNIY